MGRVGALRWAMAMAMASSGMRAASAQIAVTAFDAAGQGVDMSRSNASIERTPPERSDASSGSAPNDPDALRFVLAGPAGELPQTIVVISLGAGRAELDRLEVEVSDGPCPPGLGPSCRSTPLIRTVAVDIDRRHPLVEDRSIRAEVGGSLTVTSRGSTLSAIRVGGPRTSPIGPLGRLRGNLRLFVVRDRPKGSLPFGGDEAGARQLARRQLALANALWGQCGITFGPEADADIRVVDPPPRYLLALGCDLGLPSSGGEIRLRVDGREVTVDLAPKMSPRAAARATATVLEAAGFSAKISENSRIEPGADRTADVLVRRRNGQFATLDPPLAGRLVSDASMTACIGGVDLADGLDHFVDVDSPAGTVEERALVKAFDDGDPSIIKVFMVPAFAGGGRIGESFIYADRSSVRSVVIEDRAGIRADRASFALAHELGHILLDMPGHPDDYGVDVPTLLMDSDAADPSAFGPRRIPLVDCAHADRQSGPGALVPLLGAWPLPPSSPR